MELILYIYWGLGGGGGGMDPAGFLTMVVPVVFSTVRGVSDCFRIYPRTSGGVAKLKLVGPGFGVLFRSLFITIFFVRAPGSPGRDLLRL